MSNINPLFMDGHGVSQPWWPGKDTSASTDRFIMSHSCYQEGYTGASKDFMVSGALTIPTKGFTLSFDAQSVNLRGGEHTLSDLHLFILNQAPTKETLPTAGSATKVYEKVPYGQNPDVCEGDWTHYELSLDEWVGKTIYIAFANLNYDKDILAMDNILVRRLDDVEVTATAPEYVLHGTYAMDVTVKNTSNSALPAGKLEVKAGNALFTADVPALTAGQSWNYKCEPTLGPDEHQDWSATVNYEGMNPVSANGRTIGMAFIPEHRVLFEETTGTWCGNCPMGIYTIEEMSEDPKLKDLLVPVAIHIPDAAESDPMVCTEYATNVGVNIAPIFRLNRTSEVIQFEPLDCEYDSSRENSAAARTIAETEKLTLCQVEITGAEVVDGKVRVTTEFTPAVTMDGKQVKLGYVLTEDNVGVDFDQIPVAQWGYYSGWMQHNYLGGTNYESRVNGWSDLPQVVRNVRYQHMARALAGYWGAEGSLPDSDLKASEAVKTVKDIEIPDTEKISSEGLVLAPAVNPDNLNVVVYAVDTLYGTVLNSAQLPLKEHHHSDTKELAEYYAGVDSVEADLNAPAEYYTIEGLKVSAPQQGQIYIVRRGAKATKVIY